LVTFVNHKNIYSLKELFFLLLAKLFPIFLFLLFIKAVKFKCVLPYFKAFFGAEAENYCILPDKDRDAFIISVFSN